MINKYLKLLLADNKRVIIPDFGGFVVKRSAAGDIISFNSFLKFNDDLLANLIVEKEGLAKTQALKQIKEVVKEINTSLDEKGKFEIAEVGFLIKDKKGNIRFVDQIDEVVASVLPVGKEPKDETQQLEEVVSAEKEEDTSVTLVEENDIQNNEEDENPVPVTPEVEIIEEKKNRKFWIIFIVLLIAIGAWSISHYVFGEHDEKQTTELLDQSDTNVSVVDQLSQQHNSIIEKKANDQMNVKVSSNKKGFIARIVDFFKNLFSKNEKSVVTESAINEVSAENFVMQANQVDTIRGFIVVADKDISAKGKERYNVIIGSFSDSNNADKYNVELKEDGFASHVFDRYNGFKAVSMGAYPSLDIALKVCEQESYNTPEVWVLVK